MSCCSVQFFSTKQHEITIRFVGSFGYHELMSVVKICHFFLNIMIITFVWEYTSTVYCSECGANIILHYVLVLTRFNPDVRLNLIERTLCAILENITRICSCIQFFYSNNFKMATWSLQRVDCLKVLSTFLFSSTWNTFTITPRYTYFLRFRDDCLFYQQQFMLLFLQSYM